MVMSGITRSRVIHLAEAQTGIPGPASEHAVSLLQRGTLNAMLALGRFAPQPRPTTPHAQDEVYVVMQGRGVLFHDGKQEPFEAGDLLFVAAGIEHRFEEFTDDLAVWVVFYGPQGGEIPGSTMGQMTDRNMESLLQAFADAWNRHDVDALMSMMTTDCIFEASAGNMADGERHEGQGAVRAAYAAVFEQYPDAHWGHARHFVTGDRGVSEWTFTGTLKNGKRVEVIGCDVFTFRTGKIAIKNSFRKNRPPIE